MQRLRFVIGVVVLAGWVGLLVGCGEYAWLWNQYDSHGTGGSSTMSTGNGGDIFTGSGGAGGAGGAAPGCARDCVPSPLVPWDRLTMFSIGAPGEVRPCPESAPLVGFEGFGDLHVAPSTCPACSCSPASCGLPESMHVSAAKCVDGDGATETALEVPAAWEGGCTGDAIPAGLLCGGVPCTQSLTVSAPTVTPCQASTQGAASIPDPAWGTQVRECLIGPLDGEGCLTGEVCAPAVPEGFALCLFLNGDHPDIACPAGFTGGPLVVAHAWQDERACGPCACGEAEGADCEALVSVFKDGTCGALLGSFPVAEEEGCFDLPSGSALGSKSAAFVVDKAGSCAPSGGELMGAVLPVVPVTLCCQPQEVPR